MPLLSEHLSVWEVSFRWAGLDPARTWFRLPLAARDNARTLIDAIWRVHLHCMTLSVDKWSPDSGAPPEFFIRHHLDDIEDCVAGRHYPRKLLRFALIDRQVLQGAIQIAQRQFGVVIRRNRHWRGADAIRILDLKLPMPELGVVAVTQNRE